MKSTAALITGLLLLGSAPLAAACDGGACVTARVEPGHWENRTQRVRVPGRYVYETQQVHVPGRWETAYEETCIPGRWEVKCERVLVRAGYWASTGSCGHCARVRVRPFKRVKVTFAACGPHAHRRWIEPRYKTVRQRVWIPAQTVRKPVRRWVPPCTQAQRVRVWKPACYEVQTQRVWIPAREIKVCRDRGRRTHGWHRGNRTHRDRGHRTRGGQAELSFVSPFSGAEVRVVAPLR